MNSVSVAVAVQSRSACVGLEPAGWEEGCGGGFWLQPSRELLMVKVTVVQSSGYI